VVKFYESPKSLDRKEKKGFISRKEVEFADGLRKKRKKH